MREPCLRLLLQQMSGADRKGGFSPPRASQIANLQRQVVAIHSQLVEVMDEAGLEAEPVPKDTKEAQARFDLGVTVQHGQLVHEHGLLKQEREWSGPSKCHPGPPEPQQQLAAELCSVRSELESSMLRGAHLEDELASAKNAARRAAELEESAVCGSKWRTEAKALRHELAAGEAAARTEVEVCTAETAALHQEIAALRSELFSSEYVERGASINGNKEAPAPDVSLGRTFPKGMLLAEAAVQNAEVREAVESEAAQDILGMTRRMPQQDASGGGLRRGGLPQDKLGLTRTVLPWETDGISEDAASEKLPESSAPFERRTSSEHCGPGSDLTSNVTIHPDMKIADVEACSTACTINAPSQESSNSQAQTVEAMSIGHVRQLRQDMAGLERLVEGLMGAAADAYTQAGSRTCRGRGPQPPTDWNLLNKNASVVPMLHHNLASLAGGGDDTGSKSSPASGEERAMAARVAELPCNSHARHLAANYLGNEGKPNTPVNCLRSHQELRSNGYSPHRCSRTLAASRVLSPEAPQRAILLNSRTTSASSGPSGHRSLLVQRGRATSRSRADVADSEAGRTTVRAHNTDLREHSPAVASSSRPLTPARSLTPVSHPSSGLTSQLANNLAASQPTQRIPMVIRVAERSLTPPQQSTVLRHSVQSSRQGTPPRRGSTDRSLTPTSRPASQVPGVVPRLTKLPWDTNPDSSTGLNMSSAGAYRPVPLHPLALDPTGSSAANSAPLKSAQQQHVTLASISGCTVKACGGSLSSQDASTVSLRLPPSSSNTSSLGSWHEHQQDLIGRQTPPPPRPEVLARASPVDWQGRVTPPMPPRPLVGQ